MAASESDFTDLTESGDAYLSDEWPLLVRAIEYLTPLFAQTDIAGTEPTHIIEGIRWGEGTGHNEWRIITVSGDLLVQENTGTEGTPVWTTRNTFVSGSGLSVATDHGGLGGLGDDDHTQYSLADSSRNFTGSLTVKNSADATLEFTVDAGTSAEQIAQLVLADQGTDAWLIQKNATGQFLIRDAKNLQTILTISANVGADKIVITSDGVGIGGAPAAGKELDVAGDIIADGNIAGASATITNAISGGSVDTTASNELTKAWGVTESTPSSSGGSITFDFSASNYFEVTLTESITSITLSNTSIPGPRTIVLKQAAASAFSVTGWPAGVKWANDTAPSMPSGFDDEKVITILVKADGTSFRGMYADDFTV